MMSRAALRTAAAARCAVRPRAVTVTRPATAVRWQSSPAEPEKLVGEPIGALGFEKEELEGKFAQDVLTGPFGTKEDPVVVPSIFDMRIVGCEGGPGDMQHDLLWHCVREGKPTVCIECGQYFQHVRREPVHHGSEDAGHH